MIKPNRANPQDCQAHRRPTMMMCRFSGTREAGARRAKRADCNQGLVRAAQRRAMAWRARRSRRSLGVKQKPNRWYLFESRLFPDS